MPCVNAALQRRALTRPRPAPSFRAASKGVPFPVSDDPDRERLDALQARLDEARGRAKPEKDHMEEHYSQAQLAWRMVIELVAGLGIGFGIGYGLDSLLGTRPWLMVVLTLLGFIAGVKTMIRSAQEAQRKTETAGSAGQDTNRDAAPGGDDEKGT